MWKFLAQKNLFAQSPSGSKLPKNRNLRGVKTEYRDLPTKKKVFPEGKVEKAVP